MHQYCAKILNASGCEGVMTSLTWTGALLTIILIATLFGNVRCLHILHKHERHLLMRPLYIFIFNICVADIAVVVCSLALKTVDEFMEDWVFGNVLCVMVEYSQRALFRVNVLTHVAIACERYVNVVLAFKPQFQMTKHMARYIILFMWMFSFIISIPLIFSFEVHSVKNDMRICRLIHLPWDWLDKLYSVFDLTVFFIIPFALLLFLYGRIITTLNRRKRQTVGLGSVRAALNTIRAVMRGVRVSIAVVVVFSVCWIPVVVKGFNRLVHENVNTDRTDALYAAAMYMAFLNDALVPILYCVLDKNLAPSFLKIFRCFNNTENNDNSGFAMNERPLPQL